MPVTQTADDAPFDSQPAPSLRRNMAYAAAGNTFYNGCRVLAAILIAKYGSARILGTFSASLAWSAPVVTFMMLQLRGAYVADPMRDFTFGVYHRLRQVGMLASAAVLLGLLVWRATSDPALIFTLMFAAVCLGKIVWGLGEIHWGVFQERERLDLLAWTHVLRGLAMLIPFAILLPLYHHLIAAGSMSPARLPEATVVAIFVTAAGWIVIAQLFDQPRASAIGQLDNSWDWPAVGRLARQTAPLGVVVLMIAICEQLPQMVIDGLGPDAKDQLGYFSAMVNFVLPINMLIIALGLASANRIATYYLDDRRAFVTLTLKLLGLTIATGGAALVAVVLFGEPLLRIVYTPEYTTFQSEFVIVMAGGALLLLASLLGIIVTSIRQYWIQVPIQIAVLAMTAAVAWLAIPDDPVGGGAWTFLARGALQAGLYALVLVVEIVRPRRATQTE
ncbi:MAG: hypothetical protein JXO22_15360 [Phycisphaerae bacterium]|nr:hypothetical protein [Phycisphaerae bacterium]